MSASTGAVLRLLRLGDNAFPAGGFAFSGGLEGACRDGFVTGEDDVLAFLAEQLTGRWHPCDRVLLRRAWDAAEVRDTDRFAEALATSDVLRGASRRAGAAMLGTFAALGGGEATAFRRAVLAGDTPGHLPVVQAVCHRESGLTLEEAETLGGWQVIAGTASAALRLGLVGHIGAQRLTGAALPVLTDLLAEDPPPEPSSFTAYAEIAAQRRTTRARLFAS